jgi:hypothetical protein
MSVDTRLSANEMIPKLQASIARGADWIAARVAEDGEPTGADRLSHWYRVPWSMAVAGRPEVGSRALAWIEREALTPEGDLKAGAPQLNWNQAGWTVDAASYPLAILATGAWHLERYDTAGKIMETLRAFQDPETGGGYVERPDHRETGKSDLLCTAQLGMAALITGRMDIADAAFAWLKKFYEEQPDLPNKLYLRTADGAGLITDVPEGEEFGHVLDTAEPRQAFFMPGIGAAFAGRYVQATGDTSGIAIGRGLLEVSENAHESQYDFEDTVHVGKFGWGAGVMLNVEGEQEETLADAIRLGQWYLDSQLEDGRWEPTKFLVPEPDDADALWKTAEHIVLMTMVQNGLAAYPRTPFGA